MLALSAQKMYHERMVDADTNEMEIGPLLRQLRGRRSLREVTRLTGISDPYLSNIETGSRRPGPKVLKKLATLYGVSVHELLKRAGHLEESGSEGEGDEAIDVERAYNYVLADRRFRFGTKPVGPLTVEAKRFIVEMYQKFTGKELL